MLHQYTVTQLRLGAMCPRVHYFDAEYSRRTGQARRRVSLLWKEGGVPAGGALFHRSVERFTRLAALADPVRAAIESATTADELHQGLGRYFQANCLDFSLRTKPVELQRGFSDALFCYLKELANVALAARVSGIGVDDIVNQLFGDPRKRVNVTFDLQDGAAVRVTGIVDYVFFDWRSGRHRILDYKLTPGHSPHGDLVQVAAYALMHDRQHGTHPDVAVYYLHPERQLVEKPWESVWDDRAQIYDYLASMIAWERFDEHTGEGLRPPGVPDLCSGCSWRKECVPRLGPKESGDRLVGWEARFDRGDRHDPLMTVRKPPETLPEPEIVEEALTPVPDPTPLPAAPPPAGLWVGTRDDGTPEIVPAAVLNTHVAVVGAAGAGKSWTAKVIAEEAIRNGIPVVAIDPQGDLVQFLHRRDPTAERPELRATWAQFSDRVETRIFTPGTSHATRLSLDPIRLPSADELAAIESPARRAEEEEGLIAACAASIAALAGQRGDQRPLETFLLQILRGMPRESGVTFADVVRYVKDPGLAGVNQPDDLIKDSARTSLAMSLNALVHGTSASLFSGGVPLNLDAMVSPTRPGKVPLNVIYVNAMTNDAQKQFFVASLASEIYRWMITSGSAEGGKTKLLFYIDEAKDFLPAGAAKTPAKQPLLRLFAQGRKYGVGCLICTQSPRSVDYNAFTNCSSKAIGRLESSQDVERVREWFTTGETPTWLGGRKGAAKGSFVARWEGGDPSGVGFRGRALFSAHEGAWSPDRLERELDPFD